MIYRIYDEVTEFRQSLFEVLALASTSRSLELEERRFDFLDFS